MSKNNLNTSIDDEWDSFLSSGNNVSIDGEEYENELIDDTCVPSSDFDNVLAPEASELYISTRSKIAYLSRPIDLKLFWDIPVIPYAKPCNGIIKKQIKANSTTPEELQLIKDKLKNELYYEEQVMTSINNPSGRIKFKDIRKITIGISKKDIMTYRSKKKLAFYNCFVMILRLRIDAVFKEFHVKVFNTGKLEIPGVQNDETFDTVLNYVIETLQPLIGEQQLTYKKSNDNILINSNFNCGFFINRDALYDILKMKYNIQSIYDSCSYPGIQCKFYYNFDIPIQNGIPISEENKDKYKNVIEVSFMIFRTGSVLIVGMCNEDVLNDIYTFLKSMLKEEFSKIAISLNDKSSEPTKSKKQKIRRKMISVTVEPELVIEEDE